MLWNMNYSADVERYCWKRSCTYPENCQSSGSAGCFCLPCPGVQRANHYVRPKINEKGVIDIKDGRHPVVEQMIDE